MILKKYLLNKNFLIFTQRYTYLLILEREEGGEKERERYRSEREIFIGCLPYTPQLGIETAA